MKVKDAIVEDVEKKIDSIVDDLRNNELLKTEAETKITNIPNLEMVMDKDLVYDFLTEEMERS